MAKAKAKYLGQCDRVRMASRENEQNWQTMMSVREKIPTKIFLAHVDFSPLLDEETPQEYIAHATKQDPSTATYQSWWGGKRCWFLQSAGFEFIFVE